MLGVVSSVCLNGYDAPHAQIVADAVTGQGSLWLDHTPSTSPAKFVNYTLSNSGGAGTNEDWMTLDFRFRLLDDQESSDQLSLVVIRRPAHDSVAG